MSLVISELIHTKDVIGILLVGSSTQIPVVLSSYRLSGSGGSQAIFHKGKDIARSFKSQSVVNVEIRAYIKGREAVNLMAQAINLSLPISFTAIHLSKSTLLFQSKDQTILFRLIGNLSEGEMIANSGQYKLLRFLVQADEFIPGQDVV